MNRLNKSFIHIVSGLIFFCFCVPVFADKSSIEITAPAAVKKGETITITVKVIHDGNNMLHYTEWVYIKADGKEIGRWEYSMMNNPKDEIFTKEVKYTVKKTVEIEAEANCNLHGSKGKKSLKITVK